MRRISLIRLLLTVQCCVPTGSLALGPIALGAELPRLQLQRDDQAGLLNALLDGRQIVAYQYGKQFALPHYWPLRSPSGKLLTSQRPDPYPHHRSVWIADKIQIAGRRAVDFYHCWKNYQVDGDAASGFRHFIRHERFLDLQTEDGEAAVQAELSWVIDESIPVLNENRTLRIVPLGQGEYLLDLAWQLRAVKDDVRFVSDWVHYAWPYVRVHPQFSGEQGGVITDDRGNHGQASTNEAAAKWVDYSNTVEGVTEGLAVLIYPDGGTHKWLTREYGTFGPRRSDTLSGTQFTLKPGNSLAGRVGILVHRGDATTGSVARRYQQYVKGEL